MTCPGSKSCCFKCKRIMFGIFKWSEGIIRHINPMRIGQKFEADCSILQIIFPIVLNHPWPFYPGRFFREIGPVCEIREYYIFTSPSFKTMIGIVSKEADNRFPFLLEAVFGVEFNNLEW